MVYEFYEENQIHQKRIPITSAHDIIALGDERLLEMKFFQRRNGVMK